MCNATNCQHTKFDPNKPSSLTTEDLAAIWADIKATRKEMDSHLAMLARIGGKVSKDRHMAKLENTTRNLWDQFRKL